MLLYSENANEQANAKKKWCFSLHRARYVVRNTTGGMTNAVWRVFARLKMPLYSENANEQANAKKK